MSTILGLDLGERRVGVAIADEEAGGARPLTTLRRRRAVADDAAELGVLVRQHGVAALVVGLPLQASGDEGTQAVLTRAWGEAVAAVLRLPVTFCDERLTSHLAEERLGPMPRGRSGGPPSRTQRDAYRARVDREAAAIILQDALVARAGARSAAADEPDSMETHR